MWEDPFDHLKQVLGVDLRTRPNPRQTSILVFEFWPPTFFGVLGKPEIFIARGFAAIGHELHVTDFF